MRSNNPTKSVRVTHVHGFMEGKKILEELERLKEEEEKVEERKIKIMVVRFLRCQDKCVCQRVNGKCAAFNLRRCSMCESVVMKSCGKAACRAAECEEDEDVDDKNVDDQDEECSSYKIIPQNKYILFTNIQVYCLFCP